MYVCWVFENLLHVSEGTITTIISCVVGVYGISLGVTCVCLHTRACVRPSTCVHTCVFVNVPVHRAFAWVICGKCSDTNYLNMFVQQAR
jgi:hypothetical protein